MALNRVLVALQRSVLLAALSPCFLICQNARAALSPAVSQKLESGATLVVRPDNIAPRIAISLLVRAGAADETPATAGWRQVLAAAVLRATKTPNTSSGAQTLDERQQWAQARGGQFGATVSDDAVEFWATGDSRYADELLNALVQIVSNPRLSDADLSIARRYVLEQAGLPTRGVARLASDMVARQLFHDAKGAPLAYGLPNFGTFESLSSLTNEQLRAWHAQFFVPSRFTVAVAGDADASTLRAAAQSALQNSATQNNANANTPATAASAAKNEIAPQFAPLLSGAAPVSVRSPNAEGAWVFLAFRTLAPQALSPQDYAALHVLSAALDGSSEARLARRLVHDESTPQAPPATGTPSGARAGSEAASQVAAEFSPRRWAGELALLAQTSPQNLSAVQNALLDEARKLRETPLGESELQDAKNFARGRWATNREAAHDRAFEAANAALIAPFADTDWPRQIANVKAVDVQRVAQKYLRDYAIVRILPQQ